MKRHVNELGDCSGELSCRLIPTRGGQESILLCVMFWQGAQVFKNIFIEVGILWTNLFFAMGWEEGSFTFSWGLSVALNGRKWIQKDFSLRSMAVFSEALQFCREHNWAPSRKNAHERAAISSRFLCPSLPADVLWVSFVTHSFLLCGEATSALAPRLYLLFPLNQNRQTTQVRKILCCLKKVRRHLITALGQVTFSVPRLFCVQTHPPHSRFFTEGTGVGGVITQANPSRSLRAWWIPTWQMNCLSMNLL